MIEKSEFLPVRCSQFSARYRNVSRSWSCIVVRALRGWHSIFWKLRDGAGNLGQVSKVDPKGSNRTLQVERWENVILGRGNSICKEGVIIFLQSVIGHCPGHLKVVNIQNS